jgi:hypothetical protein
MNVCDDVHKMGNPQPRALETGSRFNDYSKYPVVFILWKKGHEWVPNDICPLKI